MKWGASKKRAALGLILALIALTVINQWLYAVKATNNHNYEQYDIVGTPKNNLEMLERQEKFKQEKKRIEEPSKLDTGLPRRDDNNSTMSACLLVMDDNHFLIEWLAYHYVTMPLTYVIVTADPKSRTSPQPILDRWKDRMTIVQWTDADFLPPDLLEKPNETDAKVKYKWHLERQHHFYPVCLRALRHVDRQWVAAVDVDEFLTWNSNFFGIGNRQKSKAKIEYPDTIQEGIGKFYKETLDNTTCVTIPRLLFGTFEDNSTNQEDNYLIPANFKASPEQFLTLRWKHRTGLRTKNYNRMPKSMVDVSRITDYSRQNADVHRLVRSECPTRNLYIKNQFSPLVIHHYIGTYEQFTFRNDPRKEMMARSDERYQKYIEINDGIDVTITTWIQKFVEEVGIEEANRLLEGVGDVNLASKVS